MSTPVKMDGTLYPPRQKVMGIYVHPVKNGLYLMTTLSKLDNTLCPPLSRIAWGFWPNLVVF